MAKRITIADVAKASGVSVATVDRVINGRRRVKPSTAETVRLAAETTGFYATPLLSKRTRVLLPAKKLGFVLQKRTKVFYSQLAFDLETAARQMTTCNVSIRIKFVGELAPAQVVNAMQELAEENVDAIGIVALEHPHIYDEVSRLKAMDTPVWALLSNLSSSDTVGYIGYDARKAGRSAGWGMIRCAKPRSLIAVLVGSHRYRSHEDREAGFRSYLREHGENFRIHNTISYLDDYSGAYETVSEIAAKQPELGGIYLTGGGGDGAVQAMRDEGISQSSAFICHDFSPTIRDALIDGTADIVLRQRTDQIARVAICQMTNFEARSKHLKFEMLVSENL